MIRSTLSVAAVLTIGLMAACGSSTSTDTVSNTATSSTPTPAATATASATSIAVATSLDPCQVVTSQEASQLAGVTYGAGVDTTNTEGSKSCVYGGQTLNVFTVVVAQTSDATALQAAKARADAQIQSRLPAGAAFTPVPNLGDSASMVQASDTIGGQPVSITAIDVIKGTVFLTFSDLALGHQAASAAAMHAEAQTAVGRLP